MTESDSRDQENLLFVYGTLHSGLVNMNPVHARLMSGLRLIGSGRVSGELYDLGSYPGAILGEEFRTSVCGEIYALPDAGEVLEALDAYEGYVAGELEASLFARVRTQVAVDNGASLSCWIYVYNDWVSQGTLIPDGDYRAYLKERDARIASRTRPG